MRALTDWMGRHGCRGCVRKRRRNWHNHAACHNSDPRGARNPDSAFGRLTAEQHWSARTCRPPTVLHSIWCQGGMVRALRRPFEAEGVNHLCSEHAQLPWERVSTPKGFCPPEAGEGRLCRLHRRCSSRFLAPQNPPGGKDQQPAADLAGPSVNKIAGNPDVHSDVVQIAERVLQRLEATYEPLPASSRSFAGKNILEELACVSRVLAAIRNLCSRRGSRDSIRLPRFKIFFQRRSSCSYDALLIGRGRRVSKSSCPSSVQSPISIHAAASSTSLLNRAVATAARAR
jgi:hypothetical protein